MSTEATQVSSLPLPPLQYMNLYTDENVRRGKAPRPPPPIHDSYSMFGNSFHADDTIIRPLESQGIRRLYPQNFDPRRELRKLNHSVLASFLDLLEHLVRSPESPRREEKLEDVQLLLVHMHHLVNEFRPHQARETLRVALEIQRRHRLETADRFQKHLDAAVEMLQQALAALPGAADLDCKLLVPLPGEGQGGGATDTAEAAEDCNGLDRLMCDIVDAL